MWNYNQNLRFATSIKISPLCHDWPSACWFTLKGVNLWESSVGILHPVLQVALLFFMIGFSVMALKKWKKSKALPSHKDQEGEVIQEEPPESNVSLEVSTGTVEEEEIKPEPKPTTLTKKKTTPMPKETKTSQLRSKIPILNSNSKLLRKDRQQSPQKMVPQSDSAKPKGMGMASTSRDLNENLQGLRTSNKPPIKEDRQKSPQKVVPPNRSPSAKPKGMASTSRDLNENLEGLRTSNKPSLKDRQQSPEKKVPQSDSSKPKGMASPSAKPRGMASTSRDLNENLQGLRTSNKPSLKDRQQSPEKKVPQSDSSKPKEMASTSRDVNEDLPGTRTSNKPPLKDRQQSPQKVVLPKRSPSAKPKGMASPSAKPKGIASTSRDLNEDLPGPITCNNPPLNEDQQSPEKMVPQSDSAKPKEMASPSTKPKEMASTSRDLNENLPGPKTTNKLDNRRNVSPVKTPTWKL